MSSSLECLYHVLTLTENSVLLSGILDNNADHVEIDTLEYITKEKCSILLVEILV